MQTTKRLRSLDIFRGLTIVLMIIVNSPGHFDTYAWLKHASWDGCTLADLVFPFFIVIVGMSSVLGLSYLKTKQIPTPQLMTKIIKRSVYIFMMGLLLNAFPYHFDYSNIRVMGVLQRISLCYFVSASLFLMTTLRTQLVILISCLISYTCLIYFITPLTTKLDPLSIAGNLQGFVDRLIIGPNHLYTPLFDPEGLLSTLPAIASVLLGNILGAQLCLLQTKTQHIRWLLVMGVSLAILGWLWAIFWPFNKALWSASYVLWTGGLAYLAYALCYALVEIKQCGSRLSVFEYLGHHAMFIYVLHIVLLKVQSMIHVYNVDGVLISLRLALTQTLFGHFTAANASLCYALLYTLVCIILVKSFHTAKAKIFFYLQYFRPQIR